MNPSDFQFFRKLRIAILLIIAVQLGGIVGFMYIENYSLAEAFYMTVIILSTVGLGAVHELTTEGRVFTAFLIIISLGIVTYGLSVITTYLVEGGLQNYFKYKKVKAKIEKLSGHIIVCGYGRNGKQACEQLRVHNREFVVVETKTDLIESIRADNQTLFIEGDATRDEVLMEAGIDRAKALITTLPNDAANVFVVLTARGLNSKLKIISRASEDSSFNKIKRAGADNVIMPDKIGGIHMASLIAQPDVLEFVEVITGRANFDLEEICFCDCKSEFLGKKLSEISQIDGSGANVIGMKTQEGSYVINPPGSTLITNETKLFVLGNTHKVATLIRSLAK
ncbi:MAG TPA: NAD-binding protein [Bacteroidia bacterium]|nr:NAD-binding protein [Bacteroidia bacterium]